MVPLNLQKERYHYREDPNYLGLCHEDAVLESLGLCSWHMRHSPIPYCKTLKYKWVISILRASLGNHDSLNP